LGRQLDENADLRPIVREKQKGEAILNNRFRLKVLGSAVALAASTWVSAETLREVVQIAVETNPLIGQAAKRKDAADSAFEAAKSGYFLKIDWQYGEGKERSQNSSTAQQWVKLNRHQDSMVANQMLWDGLGTRAEVERRRAISDAAAYKVHSAAEDVALQAIDAYLNVLKNQELLAYAKENLQAHAKTFDQVKLRSDKGVGRRADLDQVEARMALAIANVRAGESTLRESEIAFQRVVGRNPIALTPVQEPKAIPSSSDEAVKIGLANHPTLKSAYADIEQAAAQRELARSLWSPRLELEGSYSNHRNLDGVAGPNRDRLIMVLLKWNLFRGGFDFHRMRETAYQIDEATEISRNTTRQVENAVRLAHNDYTTAVERLPSLERYVKSSDATRAAYAQQFSIGQRTLLDLLDSENEYYTARKEYLTTKFIELSRKYNALNAMGLLLSTFDIKLPDQAALLPR
jgi:adhesin transport system outer membrane protein